jgi:hypothetical protein
MPEPGITGLIHLGMNGSGNEGFRIHGMPLDEGEMQEIVEPVI